jgi:hypothetical protein
MAASGFSSGLARLLRPLSLIEKELFPLPHEVVIFGLLVAQMRLDKRLEILFQLVQFLALQAAVVVTSPWG